MASPTSEGSADSQCEKEPSLEQLVSCFVSAKRSLSSVTHVWRANEIVNNARSLLEENAVLTAKNKYIRRTVQDRVNNLRAIQYGVDQIGSDIQTEFEALLRTLDSASDGLQDTLTLLRETNISPDLQKPGENPKVLFDFIDDTPYATLHESLKSCIDSYNVAYAALDSAVSTFDDSIQAIQSALKSLVTTIKSNPLPSVLRALESHATEIAVNLQSLVHHYDLCITALKHTEGGLPAAVTATANNSNLPTSESASFPADLSIASLRQEADAPPAPMTTSERLDMLQVLSKDATEVDDVVVEIRERALEMESQLGEMTGHTELLRAEHSSLLESFATAQAVIELETRKCTDAARAFAVAWAAEKAKIEDGLEEAEGLRAFYAGFADAYRGLLSEAARRKKVQEKMERVAREAERKINELYEDDIAARTAFHDSQGAYLPLDIWSGLTETPLRYQVISAGDSAPVNEPREEKDNLANV